MVLIDYGQSILLVLSCFPMIGGYTVVCTWWIIMSQSLQLAPDEEKGRCEYLVSASVTEVDGGGVE